jgi:hypothetical protein
LIGGSVMNPFARSISSLIEKVVCWAHFLSQNSLILHFIGVIIVFCNDHIVTFGQSGNTFENGTTTSPFLDNPQPESHREIFMKLEISDGIATKPKLRSPSGHQRANQAGQPKCRCELSSSRIPKGVRAYSRRSH